MKTKSKIGIISAILPLVAACSVEIGPGGGPAEGSGNAGGSAGSGGTSASVDPEKAETPDADYTLVGMPDGETIAEDQGALEVTPQAFAILAALQHGTALSALPAVDGMSEFVDAMTASLPVAGAPNAMCADVTIPVGASGCAELYPELLDGGSYDTDGEPSELPLAGLEGSLSTYQACGIGTHAVQLSVYDPDGSFSTCTSSVRLCDPASDDSCPTEVEKTSSTIAIAAPPVAMACRWVITGTIGPKPQQKLTLSNYSYQEKGPGPRYWRTSKDLEARSCLNPPDHQESFSETLAGDVDFDVNVVCFDAGGKAVVDPKCDSTVETRAFYRSAVRAMSEDGLACGGNAVEAYAQDETSFTVNNTAIFAKSAIVQNGTEASTSVSFNLGAGVGTSKDGLSANASVGFGWTRNFTDKTADKTDFLFADGYASQKTPVTARLSGRGRTYLKVHDRTWGISDVRTGQWLAMYTGASQCPGAGRIARGSREYYVNVLSDERKQDVAAANAFLKARNFNLAFKK